MQCLLWPQHVYATEDRLFPGGVFQEHLLSFPEQFQNKLASIYDSAFVVDDRLFERIGCKKTELGSRIFDHVSMKFRKGYRLMTLSWTDGNTFFPVNSSLLASSKAENLIGSVYERDGRSLAARQRKLAQMKGTDVMIERLKTAQSVGHHADYVLFDTWFSSTVQLIATKDLVLDSIVMIKKSPHIL